MRSRKRRGEAECDHDPRLMAMPEHPDFVAVECLKCHATTGYGLDADEAWRRWRAGDVVVVPEDILEETR